MDAEQRLFVQTELTCVKSGRDIFDFTAQDGDNVKAHPGCVNMIFLQIHKRGLDNAPRVCFCDSFGGRTLDEAFARFAIKSISPVKRL